MACLTICVLLLAAAWPSEAVPPPREECKHGVYIPLVPNVDDCKTYYQCAPGHGWIEMNCGPGTAFNPFFQVCDYPENVPCDSTTTNDACASNPCQNGGTCSQNGNGFECRCTANYRGIFCETYTDPNNACASNPCQNGGTCSRNGNGFVCRCTANYGGIYCETYTSPTCTHDDRQTLNDGNCGTFLYCDQGTWRNYKCPVGYNYNPTWKDCFLQSQYPCTTTPTGSCSSNPCQNGATCTSSGTSFVCQCPSNYEGTFCEILVISDGPTGFCNTNERDQPDTSNCGKFYSCRSNQWTQYNCPTEAPAFNSSSSVCDYIYNVNCGARRTVCAHDTRLPGNHIECTQFFRCINNDWTLYNCAAGSRFDNTLKDCTSNTTCATAPNTQSCSSAPCLNGGICRDIDNINFVCQCPVGYTGNVCQTGTPTNNACFSGPCQSGGLCTNVGNSFSCQCPAGYAGDMCQFVSQPCSSSPCLNGGVCNSLGTTYSCTCQPNYGGRRCETRFIVDGSWSSWSTDATPTYPCDRVCGGGQERYIRRRTCTKPAPSNGGRQCLGDNTDTISIPCNVGQCPCASNPCNFDRCYDVSTTAYTCGCPAYRIGNQCQTGCAYPCPPNVAIIYPDISNSSNFVACFNQRLIFTSCPDPAFPSYRFDRNDCV